jgi:hypothetical protein
MRFFSKPCGQEQGAIHETHAARSTFAALLVLAAALCVTACGGGPPKPDNQLVVNGTAHTFSIGKVSQNGGVKTVELLGDGQPIKFKGSFSGGAVSFTSPLKMALETNGQRIECDNDITLQGSNFIFRFNTEAKPDKIIVYTNDDAKSTITFDGKAGTP